ncbi:MAG: hypothetical protein HY791_31390 [Deltaproteobacteria bacterium]|nr:hypothetical protein [Deltaproteobacteria bacterium]
MRALLTSFVGYLLLSSSAQGAEGEPISQGRYVTAGVVSIFFSLGIGHAVAGEYTSTGWIFTVGETASCALFGAGLVRAWNEADSGAGEDPLNLAMIGVGATALLALKVWETYDIFTRPTVESASTVAILPLVYPSGGGVGVSIGF